MLLGLGKTLTFGQKKTLWTPSQLKSLLSRYDADAEKIEGYLAHKWGLTNNLPSGHPYKNEAP